MYPKHINSITKVHDIKTCVPYNVAIVYSCQSAETGASDFRP